MNIYIAGLSYRTNDADLTNLFAEFGEVSSAKVIMDRETGKSRGFAFVEMANEEEGQKAIDELNGVEYDQRWLRQFQKILIFGLRESGGNLSSAFL